MTTSHGPRSGTASSFAVVVSSVLLIAVGTAIITVAAARRAGPSRSAGRALEAGVFATAGASLAGLSAFGALVGVIAMGPPRDRPSLLQVTVFDGPAAGPDPGVTPARLSIYLGLNLLLCGGFTACAVLSRRRHFSIWRPRWSALGLLDTVLRSASAVVLFLIVSGFLLLLTLGPVIPIGLENPMLEVGVPGGGLLAAGFTAVMLAAAAALVARLLFRKGS